MNMLGNNKTIIRFFAAGALILGPSIAISGSYGSAGVADAKVGQFAAQTGVWCPALEATIPENLFSQMDCGAQNVARSAVAGERITNRSRGLFGIFAPHEPRGGREPQDDSDATPIASADPSSPSDPSGPSGPSPETPTDSDPTPTASGVDKWDRMNDLGVTQDNYSDQGSDFYQSVKDYQSDDGYDGDWSDFEPSS